MGLAEKKVIKDLEDNAIPKVREEMKQVLGSELNISVDWESFETEKALKDLYGSALGRSLEGIKRVCKDDLGKEALAETVKTLAFRYVVGSEKSMNLADGTFTISGGWGDSLSDIFTDYDISKYLESNL